MTLCAPWLAADDVTLCDSADPNLPRALLVASHLLYNATAKLYPGLCSDKIWPCSSGAGVQYLDYSTGGSRPINVMGGCSCTGSTICGGTPTVAVPGTPISAVVEVLINGDVVPARIVDDELLVRTDGTDWPCRNQLYLPDGSPGTWSIEYTYGLLPPPPLILAVEVLACQLIAGWCTGPDCPTCLLPKRLTQLTYEGATVQTLDPFDFLDNRRFGILEIDTALAQYNPNGLDRNGVMRSPRDFLARPHRVR